MELRQLGDEHGEQGHGVDHKVTAVVLGVEAGQDVAGGCGGRLVEGGMWGKRRG